MSTLVFAVFAAGAAGLALVVLIRNGWRPTAALVLQKETRPVGDASSHPPTSRPDPPAQELQGAPPDEIETEPVPGNEVPIAIEVDVDPPAPIGRAALLMEGVAHPLPSVGSVEVGKGTACDILLPTLDPRVSRRQFRVTAGPGGLSIHDLSSNGTLVNGFGFQRRPLRDGDVIELPDGFVIEVQVDHDDDWFVEGWA